MRRRARLITLAACAAALATVAGLLLANQNSAPGAGHYDHLTLVMGGSSYRYVVYVPPGYRGDSAVPLVVVLHGCNTTADQQTVASGYDPLAREHRFIVVYPDVDAADSANGHCWKGIWDSCAETRGSGDAGAIAAMTRAVMAHWHIDRSRVYAIGISAGAFETSILAAAYPDLYAAVGIHSGARYMGGQPGCAPRDQAPADTGVLARAALAAMGPRARVMPVIVFHGDQDNTIPFACGQQALDQWLSTNDLILQPSRPPVTSTPSVVSTCRPGRTHLYRRVLSGQRGLPGGAAVDHPRDGPLLVRRLGQPRGGSVQRPTRAQRRRGFMGVLLPLAALWTRAAVPLGPTAERLPTHRGSDRAVGR